MRMKRFDILLVYDSFLTWLYCKLPILKTAGCLNDETGQNQQRLVFLDGRYGGS